MSDVSPSSAPSSTASPTPTPSGGSGVGEISLSDFQNVVAFTAAAGSADSVAQWLGIDASVFAEGSAAGSGESGTPSPTATA
jgi:hypothetical protein